MIWLSCPTHHSNATKDKYCDETLNRTRDEYHREKSKIFEVNVNSTSTASVILEEEATKEAEHFGQRR